jgi:hypothetical protein
MPGSLCLPFWTIVPNKALFLSLSLAPFSFVYCGASYTVSGKGSSPPSPPLKKSSKALITSEA